MHLGAAEAGAGTTSAQQGPAEQAATAPAAAAAAVTATVVPANGIAASAAAALAKTLAQAQANAPAPDSDGSASEDAVSVNPASTPTHGPLTQELLSVLAHTTAEAAAPTTATAPAASADAGSHDDDAASVAGAAPAGLTPAPSAPGPRPETVSANAPPIQTPVGGAGWADTLGTRLTLMAHQGVTSASLRLSPEHLGPLEVKISLRDNNASVLFGAPQADTRAALEQALPRLRELFAQQGLHLAHAGVSGESPRSAPHTARTTAVTASDGAREPGVISVTTTTPASQGLLDTYA
jgi:flagellar hook-length control protein FliK